MGVEIRGLGKFNQQMKSVPKLISKAVESANEELVELVRGDAESNLASSVKHGSGELVWSPKTEVAPNSKGVSKGRVWTDKKTGIFRELGTGPVGEASAKDLPEGIHPVYTQTPWFFPVDSVDQDLTALYGMFKITIQGKEFYKTSGQPSRPWLYPALKSGTKDSGEIVKRHVTDHLRKGLR